MEINIDTFSILGTILFILFWIILGFLVQAGGIIANKLFMSKQVKFGNTKTYGSKNQLEVSYPEGQNLTY